MGILIGVQFLFAKAPVCGAFSLPFNESRLCGDPETVVAEPFAFCPFEPFNDWYVGMSTFLGGMSVSSVKLHLFSRTSYIVDIYANCAFGCIPF